MRYVAGHDPALNADVRNLDVNNGAQTCHKRVDGYRNLFLTFAKFTVLDSAPRLLQACIRTPLDDNE